MWVLSFLISLIHAWAAEDIISLREHDVSRESSVVLPESLMTTVSRNEMHAQVAETRELILGVKESAKTNSCSAVENTKCALSSSLSTIRHVLQVVQRPI
ncbi:hypothetical protein BKA93DRAFT_215870 [Sparassis latifolia]